MTSDNKKILGIVQELISNSLQADSKEINIKISRNEETIIEVVDDGRGMDEKTLDYVTKVLNQPKRKDMESFYEGLVGHSSQGSGLNLVGLLSSEAQVESSSQGTRIIIRRKK